MIYLLRWWLATSVLGAIALPLTHRALGRLPDRGYTAARPLGMLLAAYLVWLGGSTHTIPYSGFSAGLIVAALAVASAVLWSHDYAAIRQFIGEHYRYVACVELLFLLVLLVTAFLRSYQPDLFSSERPFEFADFNAVLRARSFPPEDPWLSGHAIGYYYFGYVISTTFSKLTATPPSVALNVAISQIAALSAVMMMGLTVNIAALSRKCCILNRGWVLCLGLLGAGLLLVAGNLEGIIDVAAAHDWIPQGIYTHLRIAGLQPYHSTHWYPDRINGADWLHSVNLGSHLNVFEFPAFSLMSGNLHPHLIDLPFKLLALESAILLLVRPEVHISRQRITVIANVLFIAFCLGATIAINPWDYPVLLIIVCVCYLFTRLELSKRSIIEWTVTLAVIVSCSVAFYAPYLLTGTSSILGIRPVEAAFPSPRSDAQAWYLPVQHLAIFWLPLLLAAMLFVISCSSRHSRQLLSRCAAASSAAALAPIVLYCVSVANDRGLSGLRAELHVRSWGFGWLTVILLAACFAFSLTNLLAEHFTNSPERGRSWRIFLLLAATLGVLLIYGPELFYFKDATGVRVNTPYKLWYSSWMLFAIVAAAGTPLAIASWLRRAGRWRPTAWAVAGAAVALLGGSLVYPLYGAFSITRGFSGPTSLDALASLARLDPDEFHASQWLNAHLHGTPRIAEASGDSGTHAGRIASRTGLPTILGWKEHEYTQRGLLRIIDQRQADVAELYQTQDLARAHALLAEYAIQYVVVGDVERQQYGTGGLAKFAQLGTPIFETSTVTIYAIAGAVAPSRTKP